MIISLENSVRKVADINVNITLSKYAQQTVAERVLPALQCTYVVFPSSAVLIIRSTDCSSSLSDGV